MHARELQAAFHLEADDGEARPLSLQFDPGEQQPLQARNFRIAIQLGGISQVLRYGVRRRGDYLLLTDIRVQAVGKVELIQRIMDQQAALQRVRKAVRRLRFAQVETVNGPGAERALGLIAQEAGSAFGDHAGNRAARLLQHRLQVRGGRLLQPRMTTPAVSGNELAKFNGVDVADQFAALMLLFAVIGCVAHDQVAGRLMPACRLTFRKVTLGVVIDARHVVLPLQRDW